MNPTRSNASHICKLVSSTLKFQVCLLYHFWVTDHRETKCTEWPKMTLTLQGHRYPTFYSILLYVQPFSSYRPFQDQCIKWPQNDLEPKRSNVPHICVTSVPDSIFQSVSLYGQPFFELQPILNQSALNKPKLTLNLSGQLYSILYVASMHESQILLYDQAFLRYRPFLKKCTEWPPNDLDPYRLNLLIHVLLVYMYYNRHFPWYSKACQSKTTI